MTSFLRVAQFSLIIICIVVISFFFGVIITLDVSEIQQSKLHDEYEKEICKAVHVLDCNHQGVDIIIDNDTNELCFLEIQPTYSSGYPNGMGAYRPPYYNPYDQFLVNFLQQNEQELSKTLPRYYNNWLDKRNHFDLVYKSIKEHTNVWS